MTKNIKIAINGFGRIGRPSFRRVLDCYPNLEVVAINDLAKPKILAHLLKYDSAYGICPRQISADERNIIIDDKKYPVLAEKDPTNLPWTDLGVDVVLECTGFFTDFAGANKHITAGAKKVIISAPCKSSEIKTFILGVNADKYADETIIDMGSCTTNCVAPVVKILNDEFGIEKSFFTTVHAYTSTQKLVDGPDDDLRRARAAALNISPTTSGAAISVVKAIPALAGKLDGMAMRIPVPTVSVSDIVAVLTKSVSLENLKTIFIQYAKDKMKGILDATNENLVSSDFKADPHSSIIDLPLTRVMDNMVKVMAWYDNEFGYACRLVEMAEFIAERQKQ